ncbi:MAG: hypothetical protein Q7S32_04545 [bacterium]|nr:hypothetical protein [bacterium]
MEHRLSTIWVAIIVTIVLVGGLVVGFWIGDQKGYARAEADVKKVQEEAGKKAAEDAAKAANPFQAANPLEGVEANPFEKTKSILNPFK